MSFIENYRQRRTELSGPESVETLEHMELYFRDGSNWTKDMYQNADGARCLRGAAYHVRTSPIDDAPHWLRLAIAEVAPGVARIEDFNDTRSTYAEVAAVIRRAKELATQSISRALATPAPVVEILPPERRQQPVAVFNPRPVRATPRRNLAGWIMD